MARRRPADRFATLIDAATRVFIRSGGFKKTQIGDIAAEMGVAKGTVYLYVESKEALFDLAVRAADDSIDEPAKLPVPTPAMGSTLEFVTKRIKAGGKFASLSQAEKSAAVSDGTAELRGILEELYDRFDANRTTIKLVGASSHDMPQLAEIWFESGRRRLNKRLAKLIAKRSSQGSLREDIDPLCAARMITETVTWFAVHRHFDLHPDNLDAEASRATVIDGLTRAFAT